MDRANQGQEWRGTTQTAINCDTFWLQTLGRHEIVLWQIQKFICYCTVFALFYFVFEGTFQVQAPRGLYSEGRFNGGFFALRVWGAYIWRGLFSEFYGISTDKRGPVKGGARVPRLNFTASYVAISEHSHVACRNFNNNFQAHCQSDNPYSLQRRQQNIRPLAIFSTFKPRVLRPL